VANGAAGRRLELVARLNGPRPAAAPAARLDGRRGRPCHEPVRPHAANVPARLDPGRPGGRAMATGGRGATTTARAVRDPFAATRSGRLGRDSSVGTRASRESVVRSVETTTSAGGRARRGAIADRSNDEPVRHGGILAIASRVGRRRVAVLGRQRDPLATGDEMTIDGDEIRNLGASVTRGDRHVRGHHAGSGHKAVHLVRNEGRGEMTTGGPDATSAAALRAGDATMTLAGGGDQTVSEGG